MLLSIILPTYREAGNLSPMCRQISAEMQKGGLGLKDYEILVMDDCSDDGSAQECDELQKDGIPLRFVERKQQQRGLSPAVLDGLKICRGEYCCVMDADMSHPADAILPMLQKMRAGEADFCLGSRYTKGGRIDENWTRRRLLMSRFATFLSLPLIRVADPMSGFFILAKASMPSNHELSPLGYKIALELLVKGNYRKVYEHPIYFRNRLYGESKMGVREQFLYLQHLRRLYKARYPVMSEFVHFGLVGGSGFVVDVALYYIFQFFFNINHIAARALSFWGASTWNWYWNRTITFSDYFKSMPLTQWISFVAVSLFGFLINWGSYVLLTGNIHFFEINKLVALMLGVIAGLGFNFMFSRIFIFRHLED